MKDLVAAVEASSLFRGLAAANPGVEVWPDEEFAEGGWSYAWIVSRSGEGAVRNLAYVRLQGGRLERRTYDDSGDDLWVVAE
jgi:hypothetical protein